MLGEVLGLRRHCSADGQRWVGRRWGVGRLWLWALAGFTASSVLCALAPTIGLLIAARVLQGGTAGLLIPAGQTILGQAVGPHRLLRAQLAAAEAHGARVVREQVVAVEPDGDGWRVTTVDGTVVRAAKVLLATGAHTDELGPVRTAFPGIVRPETVVLATLDAAEQERLAALPSVFSHLAGTSFRDLYQVPPAPYPDGTVKLKLGATLREWEPLATGEARRAWMSGDAHQELLPELRGLVEDLVPGIRADAWATKPCMITDTPSGVPTVDHLAPGLVAAAGGNGYAAKSADAIGALAAGLLVAGAWTDTVLEREPFARTR